MKAFRIVLLVSTLLMIGACGRSSVGGGSDTTCPETHGEEGNVDGINLPSPDWLPTAFPLPNGISIRHIDNQLAGGEGARFLTGFIPGGNPAVVVAGFSKKLRAAGYEILFAAEGEIPEFTEAIVALHTSLKMVVGIDVSKTELPVRVSDGKCPGRPGLLVGMKFNRAADAAAARALYPPRYNGKARAVIGGSEFLAKGQCSIQEGAHIFESTSGAGIRLQGYGSGESVTANVVTVDVDPVAGVIFNLDDGTLGTKPTFAVSKSGFSMEGVFVNGGNSGERLVKGRIAVSCDYAPATAK